LLEPRGGAHREVLRIELQADVDDLSKFNGHVAAPRLAIGSILSHSCKLTTDNGPHRYCSPRPPLNPEAALTTRARVAWAHDWVSDPTLAALFQTLPGASFVVNRATPAKNSALTSAGAELRQEREAVIDHVVGEDPAVGVLRRLRRIETQHIG